MARSSECKEQYAQKVLDTADIVREAICRQIINTMIGFSGNKENSQLAPLFARLDDYASPLTVLPDAVSLG
jgi:hypothetical protein